MRILRLFIILIAVWFIGIYISLPSWPIRGEIIKIHIKYTALDSENEFTLDTQEEIRDLKEACGIIWFTPFVYNSAGAKPSWVIDIIRPDGSKDRLYVDENEFGLTGKPNSRILEYLKLKYS